MLIFNFDDSDTYRAALIADDLIGTWKSTLNYLRRVQIYTQG